MRKILFTAVRIAALAAIAGCASVYRVSESSPDAIDRPVPAAPKTRKPVASVTATPADAGAKALAASLKSSLEGSLAARGFDVTKRSNPDSVVSLAVSRTKAAGLAEWRIYEGTVDARVTDAATGRLVSRTSFSAKGDRALDEAKAEERLRSELSRRISDWLAKVLPARKVQVLVPPHGCATVMLTLSPADPLEKQEDVLVVQRRFMDAVGSYPGIVSCRLAQEIPSRRAFVFRVEYRPEQFPGGLLNTLVLDSPSLGSNVKLEIVR